MLSLSEFRRLWRTVYTHLTPVGDQLTANNNVGHNATAYYDLLARHLEPYGVPWAMIFGNHDDMPLEQRLPNGTVVYNVSVPTSRRELIQSDAKHRLSLSQAGPDDVFGVSNYWLDVCVGTEDDYQVGARIVILDSGGGSLPERIDESQIAWFQERAQDYADVPIVAFQHIPTSLRDFAYDASTCQGMQEDGIAPLENNGTGLMDALTEAGVHFLAVGHNHGNDYCCPYNNTLHVCFGRHSGYGGYGGWDRGARVYRLELTVEEDEHNFAWSSYVRLESGDIVNSYEPS